MLAPPRVLRGLVVVALSSCPACSAPVHFVEAPYVVATAPEDAGPKPLDSGPSEVDAQVRPPLVTGDTWTGTYVCAQGVTEMQLRLLDVQGADVLAVFAFQHGPTGVRGDFEMRGSYVRSTRRVRLTAGKWLSQPNGYVTVDLEGRLTPDGKTLSGHILGPGCTIFELHAP
jgi:hypothetical protein